MGFTITVKTTCVVVSDGKKAMDLLTPIIRLLTYEDEFVEETKFLGYLYNEETDELYLHKGVDVEYIKRLLGNYEFIRLEGDKPEEMSFIYEELVPPRSREQEDIIHFMAGTNEHSDNLNQHQLFLIAFAGFGKTFCASTASCILNNKTLIITHRRALRDQWRDSLFRMIGLTDDEVYTLDSSHELYDIANGEKKLNHDIYLMTHSTFRAGLKLIGDIKKMGNITKNLGIGFKIIDEVHLEFRDTLLIDFAFNVERNLYLTATEGRSAKDENSIFKYVFGNALYYKPSSFLLGKESDVKKWVEYTTVEVNTHVKPAVYQWRVAGGRGMNPASYGKWVIANDKKQTHFKTAVDLLKMIYKEDEKAKVLVFMPLIDLCSEFALFCHNKLDNDEEFGLFLNIKTINSSNTPSENEYNKRADVIITTIASCGTGTDISGVTGVIACSPYFSKITAIQTFGRLRYNGKKCYYYDIFDASVPMDRIWLKNRIKTLKPKALSVNHVVYEPDNDK